MPISALVVLVYSLPAAFLVLFGANTLRKLAIDLRERKNAVTRKAIKGRIEEFLNRPEGEFHEAMLNFTEQALHRGSNYRALMDAYLLNTLELSTTVHRDRLVTIAEEMLFPSECIAQIKSKNLEVSAQGSRRAGLYNVKEAVGDMLAVLDNLYSENQFAVLMALARIGNSEAMQLAFEKIKTSIIINEQAAIEILSSFPDNEDKRKLFKEMIHSDANYIAELFLKAAGKEMATALVDDMKIVLHNGSKGVRAAAARGLASLGENAPLEDLLLALEDSDWEVRALAAKALGAVATPKASAALFKALSDQQWWVRQNAARAMLGHPGYETMFMLAAEIGDEYTRDSILSVLEDGGNPLLLRYIKIMAA